MKKLLTLLAGLMLSIPMLAQRNLTTPFMPTWFNAADYNYSFGQLYVAGGGSTSSGTFSITVSANGAVVIGGGRRIQIFGNSTLPAITIGTGSTQETVTPSSSSGCTSANLPISLQQASQCVLTATFSYAHGYGEPIVSGDSGYIEALNDAGNNGGGNVLWQFDCGIITLSTSGATTTSTCNVPKTFVNLAASVYVTTTVTTAASYSLGISGHTASFMSSCTTLTAGSNCSQFMLTPAAVNGGTGTGALLVTANATPGAGALHVKVSGYTAAQSTY